MRIFLIVELNKVKAENVVFICIFLYFWKKYDFIEHVCVTLILK